MRRQEYIEILDGTHPHHGRAISLAHQGLIILSALAITLQTVPALPGWADSALYVFEACVLALFLIEYIARIVCARQPLRYIFSFWGVVDLLSCLPALTLVNSQWAVIRSFRLLRLVRLLKLLHANRALHRFETALIGCRGELAVFAFLAGIVLYIAAVGIFIFEHEAQPDVFTSIPRSLWWAVVSFTTVGYGDMYPITAAGRFFTTCILFVGLGVIAVPTAIITSALLNTDIRRRIEREIEGELDEIEQEVRKDLEKLKRRPTRRK